MFVHSEIAAHGRLTTTVVGELDMATAPLLLDHAASLESAPQVIDLRFVSFIDASGIDGLLEIRRRNPITTLRSDAVADLVAICDLEEQLPAESSRLDPALRHADVAVGVHDDRLRFVYVNDALAGINGLPAEDHLGRTGPELFDPDVDEVTPVLESVLDSRRPVSRVVVSEIDGERHPWRCVYTPALLDGRSYVVARVAPLLGRGSVAGGSEVGLRFAS